MGINVWSTKNGCKELAVLAFLGGRVDGLFLVFVVVSSLGSKRIKMSMISGAGDAT